MKNASVLSVVLAVSAVFTVSAETVTYDLTQRDPNYLQKTSTVIASWTNRNLADVTSIKGVMQGGFNPTPGVVRGVIYDRTADGFSVQFQLVNDIGNINKVLRAHFRQNGTSIVGWADRCGSSTDLKSSPQPFGYILTEEELPYTNVSTDGTTQRYGVRDIEIFGDVVQTIAEVPSAENEIQVKGGVLGIAVENGQTIANAISGDGGVAFIGTVSEEQGSMGGDAFIGTADTVIARGCDISGLDTSSLTAWLDGAFLGTQHPTEAIPARNVVWTANRLSFTAQFQYVQHFAYDNVRGALVEFSQSGADIVAKVLKVGQVSDSANPGTDRYLGTDMLGNVPKWEILDDARIVTRADGGGMGVRTVAYRAKKINRVTLSGMKTWTGGTLVDGASVNMTGSYFAKNSEVTVRNGGILDLAADGAFKDFRYISYRVLEESFLRCRGNFAIDNGDTLLVDGGTVTYVDLKKNAYFNNVTLTNGGTINGVDGIGIAYLGPSVWNVTGESAISVGVPLRFVYHATAASSTFTFNADTDLTFTGSVKEKSTEYKGLPLRKRGAAKVTFGVGADIPDSPVLLEAGTLAFLSNSSVKSLALTGTGTIEVAAGATLAIGDSSSRSWSGTGVLEFFEADRKSIRFGASASALTAAQLSRIRLNGSSAKLDANGYLVRDAGLMLLFR